MDSLDPGEFFTFCVCGVISLYGAYQWFQALIKAPSRPGSARIRPTLWLLPISLLLLLQIVLSRWADPVVRASRFYDLLFMFGGGMWLWGTVLLMPWFGVDVRIDALEQENAASAIAACGALIGTMICYAGSNIGQGDSIATTFIPAVAGTALFALLWMLVTAMTPVAVRIAIERQTGAGVRLAIYLTIIGMVIGRACAGDWISLENTIHDLFVMSWSAALATMVFILLERMIKRGGG